MSTNKKAPTIGQRIAAMHQEYDKAAGGGVDPHSGRVKSGEKRLAKDREGRVVKQAGRRTAAK